jgi:membrane-anchored mycosin MYCP
MTCVRWVTVAAKEGNLFVAYVRFPFQEFCLATEAARMSRIAVAVLGVALAAAAQTPAVAAARSARQPDVAATTKPSSKPSPKRTPSPPPKQPSRQATPSLPTPVAIEPRPTQNCPGPGQASSKVTSVPWAQEALDWSSVWPLTEGQGVTVAVVDSGVAYSPQLAGKVTAINLTSGGYGDCYGHGTGVAGIIAASDMQAQGNPFEGVAPDAKILSVKVQNQDSGNSATLAQGITDAALEGAQVINVSITTGNSPGLHAAVAFALSKGAVIVAAGGNDEQQTGHGPFYPASYPGVLSVGAVAQDGSLAPFSDLHSHVAVTAPGVNVTSATPGGYQAYNGTSFATAFVSGVAALVRSRYPRMSGPAVVKRIEETADGNTGPGTGNGLVNPMQAVTAVLDPAVAQSPLPTLRPQPVSVERAPLPDVAARTTALEVVAGALGLAALVAIGAVVIREGRRRRWRAGGMQR